MNIENFLDRVVAPGPFVCLAHQGTGEDKRGLSHRFYARNELDKAASFARWAVGKKMNVWHAVASFRMAEARDDQRGYNGSRTQQNVAALKAFWVDCDLKRPGDGKAADKVYADHAAAMVWLKSFLGSTGMLAPNMVVKSGYGLHLYWVLQDALTLPEWQPYADALKVALIASGAVLDAGLSADAARLLRPPETFNLKVPDQPMPVEVMGQLGDYPNEMVLSALQPYVGQMSRAAVNYGSGLSGAPSQVFQARPSQTNAAAQANIPSKREHLFSRIATKCAQVKQSLANHGAGDPYPLWYLGHLSLAHFCADGADYVHPISDGDPRYDAAKTDAAFAQIAAEHNRKGTGAPSCQHYERARPGVCQGCPFNGKVKSPFSLGVDDGDLPSGYRREGGWLKRRVTDDEGVAWEELLQGDVYLPALERKTTGAYVLSFTYARAGDERRVICEHADAPFEAAKAKKYFGEQGIPLDSGNARQFTDFTMAWINHLIDQCAVRQDHVEPFGWAYDKDANPMGLAIAGTLYRTDGGEETVAGGDAHFVASYTPKGNLAAWQQACDFVTAGRVDLQVLVALSFAAPLIKIAGRSGITFSAWSRDSAVGKSSAMQVGAAVWGARGTMGSMGDTPNASKARMGQMKILPAYWDEAQINTEERRKAFAELVQEMDQGRERDRLRSDASYRPGGQWDTIWIVTGNQPLMDIVIQERPGTDAGAVRLFEYPIEMPSMAHDPAAARLVALTKENYGHAGRVYAKWLAQNREAARDRVEALEAAIALKLGGVENAERFFVTGVACVTAGALFANHLGLTKFDTRELLDFLCDHFAKLRGARQENLVHGGGLDLEEVLGRFVSAHAPHRLVTETFRAPGRYPTDVVVKGWPTGGSQVRLAIHIAEKDQMMRISKEAWRIWCRQQNLGAHDILRQMKLRWNANTHWQGLLGSGTQYATGKISCVEIPLSSPELDCYLHLHDTDDGKAPAMRKRH